MTIALIELAAAPDAAPFAGPAAEPPHSTRLHGVTAVAVRFFRVVSSVAATAVPLCRWRVKAPRG